MHSQKPNPFAQINITPMFHQHSLSNQAAPDHEINLIELLQVLLKRKWLIISITIVAAIVGILYALTVTPIYRAEALLSPTTAQKSTNRFSFFAKQYSGLTGITLPTHPSLNTAIAILESRQFIQSFIQQHQLKPQLFPKQWDTQNNTWKPTPKKTTGWWDIRRFIPTSTIPKERPKKMEPSLEMAYNKLNGILSTSIDKKTELVTLSVNSQQPELAAELVNLLVNDINQVLQRKAIQKAQKSVIYLQNELNSTNLDELRILYAQLIQEQIKTVTLAKANDEYAFEVLDAAITPQFPFKPNRKLIVLLSIMIGLIMSVVLAFILHAIQTHKQKK